MTYGFVYILGNEYMPDLIKIGCTERSPWARADEISKATGVPVPFQVWCYAEFEDFQRVERDMHIWCARHRVNPVREFFHGCTAFAVSLLWHHPCRLAFTDATAGRKRSFESELVMRACNSDAHEHYFDDMRNPFADKAEEEERLRLRIEAFDDIAAAAEIIHVVPALDPPAISLQVAAVDLTGGEI